MRINLKNVGHFTALTLMIVGLLITGIGAFAAWSLAQDPSGLLDVMLMVIAALIAIGGGIFTLVIFGAWVFGTLVQLYGFKAVFIAIGTLATLFYIIRQVNTSTIFRDPISLGTIDGIVYQEPSFAGLKDFIPSPNSSVLLISMTDSIFNGYPWFIVSYNKSSKGYMWGGNLCAQDIWVNGLRGRCTSHQQKTIMTSFERNKIDVSTKPIDVIEFIHKMLPGSWYNPSYRYSFNKQGEILSEDDIIGRWTIKIDEGSKQKVWLTLEGNEQNSWVSSKQKIKGLDSLWLYLNDESYSRIKEYKWGLTIAERIAIEQEIFKSQERAWKKTEKKLSADNKHPQFYYYKNLLEKKYAKELAIKYGIPTATLDSIQWNWR
ncbi:hypothetical protein SB49_00105 [Sediminicola sp. YIK13]|uniref:hypothetical protein n=1 Tax=Sediminicola sp. YIK13 TaxID=1453352 RepID=UPI00071EE908|nr:hypothetical protein [Sediminicola sp. YIK13]ALM06396.1 hypothetical protein SB49_00105 [Sediminicola sp. YIK13]